MLSVAGGKLTTYRRIAVDALRALRAELGLRRVDERPRPLPGAADPAAEAARLRRLQPQLEPSVATYLAHLYGGLAEEMLADVRENPELLRPLHPDGPDLAVQAVYAARREWALNAEDVLQRRTTLAPRGLADPEVATRVESLLGTRHGVRIRQAEAADVAAIQACVRDAYAPYVARIGREPAPMTADYAELVARNEVWVATERDTVVGVLVLRPQTASLLLENVAVMPARQGRGIGRALMAFAERHARDLGLHEVTLYTNERMTENLRFYPARGYTEIDRRFEDGFHRVFFRKSLA
jgi:N-acetylglutamate synthase-like GNAT family acetyltransferase